MRRRKDTVVKLSSPSDIEELVNIAQNQKEYHEYQITIIKRRIELLDKSIAMLKDDFLSFLRNNGIDTNYPVFGDVVSDQVVPDTVPEDAQSVVRIEEAMLPNIPHDVFLKTINILRSKYSTLQDEIDDYTDALKRKKLDKAKLEAKLDGVQKSIEEYKDNIKEKQQDYNDSVKNLNLIKSLYQNLLDFKYLFTAIPDSFTAESYVQFQTNYLDRYSTHYYGKVKTIKKFSEILQENYVPTAVDQMEQGFYTTVFREISIYFGDPEEGIPEKYVDAIPKKKDIIKKLDSFGDSLNKLILNVKITTDSIRGVKGVGNSVVDGLITSTTEISKSYMGQRKIEQTTLKDINNNNYTLNLSVNQKVNDIKDKLQLGIENLDEKFMKATSKFLRKIAIGRGFPVTFIYDRNTNLEDHVREKVRQKYGGNIPFCDEEVTTDSTGKKIFVKKSDMDPKSGKPLVQYKSEILEKMTRTSRDITS